MVLKCSMLYLFLLVTTVSPLDENLSNLTERQRSRIRPKYKEDKDKETSIFDKRSRYLYKIIHSRPENLLIEFDVCKNEPLKLPDFKGPGLRLADVKCLENLWKMRYYDQSLISLVLCGERSYDVNLINLNFGGLDAVPGKFPHMGAIGWQTLDNTWLFLCEGALISEKFVLTAAHCVHLPKENARIVDLLPKIVRLGVADISDKEEVGKSPTDASISKINVHPYYDRRRNYYDVAIMELDRELAFSTQVHPACIWTGRDELMGEAVLTGWNVIESTYCKVKYATTEYSSVVDKIYTKHNQTVKAKEFISNSFDVFTRLSLAQKITPQEKEKNVTIVNPVLQETKVNFTKTFLCDLLTSHKRNRRWRGILYHQMCTQRVCENGNSTVQMDLGGALQAQVKIPEYSDWKMHYVIGVRSFGFGDSPLTISVYSKASTFIDWIERVVWGDELLMSQRQKAKN